MTKRDPSLDWIRALREPQSALTWDLPTWEQVIRLARRLRLLGRLAESLASGEMLDRVPDQPRRHLEAELRYTRWRATVLHWVLVRVADALDGLDAQRVLLKGAAYAGQGFALGKGRLPSDVDVLVPRQALDQARAMLMAAGWSEVELDEHDQRYYREWSHELPPLRHPVHGLELDLHHDILPPVARVHVDIGLLLAETQPAADCPGWQVFSLRDQILHASAHLFHDSELRDRLRDLVDLDALMRIGATSEGFWEDLVARSRQLGLQQSLALALALCADWLDTPVPPSALSGAHREGLRGLSRLWLTRVMAAALRPAPLDDPTPWSQGAAAWILLIRYHLGRMPLPTLAQHLRHKLRQNRQRADASSGNAG
jgi:hypothetical protein